VADERPQYQHGVGTIGDTQFHWGSGMPGKYWSIPYGDYPVTPNAPTGAWAHQAGAIPIANNVIPDPQLGRNRIGIMIHSGSAPTLDQLYTEGCFKVAPSEWPAVRDQILSESANAKNPLYLHIAPGGVAAFTHSATLEPGTGASPAVAPAAAAVNSANGTGKVANTSSGDVIDALGRNIAGIESGGAKDPYSITNPKSGAIGKYQVMPHNVPGWTLAATGKEMTPEEFQASPDAQEKVFRDQMQRSLQLYGPKDAASIWFTGKPYSVAGPDASDGATKNSHYVALATAGINDDGTTATTPDATPAAKPPQTVGDALAAITKEGTDAKGNETQSPLEKLGSAFAPKQAPTQSQPMLSAGGEAHAGAGMAGPSAQLMANVIQQSSRPLSWSTAPYGSGMAGPQMAQQGGLTLNSMSQPRTLSDYALNPMYSQG
jgi:hypothetical protein